MKNILVSAAAFFVLTTKLSAQVTQIELASGFNKTVFQTFSIKPLDKKQQFSFGTLAFFHKYHKLENKLFDEAGVQSTVFWNISKSFAVGPTLYYNSVAGFSEKVSFLFLNPGKKITFIAVPAVLYSEQTKSINGDLFIQLQFMQPMEKDWCFLIYTQMLSAWEKFSIHQRSFQQVRIGVSKNHYQFGMATDFDEYGKKPIIKTTVGIFARKIFINK